MKTLNLISVIGLVAIISFLVARNHENPDLIRTIEINDQGFSIEKLVVKKGTTITWVNAGDRLHWPASNFHPTHAYYPLGGGCLGSALDACKGLQKGESFSFKMEELGIWPMHDHLAPGLTMIVEVVKDKPRVATSESSKKEKMTPETFRSSDYGVQMSYIKQIADQDPASAWGFLKEAFYVNGSVVGNAHEFSHIIGNKLYEHEGLGGIKACDTTFAYGCMHGVTEEM
jgi:plastocyanin